MIALVRVLIALFIALPLAACGGGESDDGDPAETRP